MTEEAGVVIRCPACPRQGFGYHEGGFATALQRAIVRPDKFVIV
jgi:hypothetical protein